ncbi:6-bladed beta-propeller [Luteolibacter algae]|uniref:6-bladed beta-propeller n=1 Tax=Luteolibacter algae TaxID=454151 RepID=A0ABW5D9D8_9BACT
MKPILLTLLFPLLAHAHGPDNHAGPNSAEHIGKNVILGHGDLKYSADFHWAKVSPDTAPVINSHALAEDKNGLIYLVTDHPENAFLVFKKDGTFVRAFGKGLLGGHSLEIFEKDGIEYLVHVDCGWHFPAEGDAVPTNGKITILKTDGTIVRSLPTPQDMGICEPGLKKFMPCDVAYTPQGTLLIADGYASDYIYEVTLTGELVRRWGGPKKDDPANLSNAHGVSLDLSNPEKPLVWVPSRNETALKAFTLDGEYIETIELPGAYAGQLFFRDDKVYTAVCWSKENGTGKRLQGSGFLLVMDRKTKKVLSAPGGTEPVYKDGVLQPLMQDPSKPFFHGHDLYVDAEGSIYLGEWAAQRRYPCKLTLTK